MTNKFLTFAAMGTLGFCIDAGVLYALLDLVGPYAARALSFSVAVTATWLANRCVTFQNFSPPLRQWVRFVGVNSVGGTINYAIYAGLILLDFSPIVALGCGSLAGLLWNFNLSARLVFR